MTITPSAFRRLTFFRRPFTLRSHLTVLVLVTMIPLLIFSGLMIYILAKQERDTFQKGATERTRALLTAVDTDLRSSITRLEALAALRFFDNDDLQRFREEAARVLKTQPDWWTINVALPSGQQIMNLLRSSDAPLPMTRERKSFEQVLRTGKPAVGNIVQGPVTQEPEFSVRVPVARNGITKYVLSAVVKPETIGRLIVPQKLPNDWIGVVLDSNNRFVTRSIGGEKLVGRPASESLRAALARSPEGWFRGTTVEGWPVYTPYNRSPFSGWTVAMGIPASVVDAPLHGPVLYVTFIGAGLLMLGIALAWWLSSKTAGSIESLIGLATNLGLGKDTAAAANDVPARVTEVEHLKDTFLGARRLIQQRSEDQHRLEEALRHDVAQRMRAEQFLLLQITTSRALIESEDLKSATPKIVQAICELTGWEVGAIWEVDRAANELTSVEVWHLPTVSVPEFEAASRQIKFAPGVGLAGRVWASGEPAWIPDVTKDSNFLRIPQATKEGLHTGVCFPITMGTEVLGVIECFSHEIRELDRDTLQTLANIGAQLGQFIERKRIEAALHESEERLRRFNTELEAKVEERTAELAKTNQQLRRVLTERERLAEQLLQAQKMESIGTLAGGVAHDFNNILNIIQAYASVLTDDGARSEEIGENVTVIKDTVKRGAALVQQLLTVARKSEGVELESVELNPLVERLVRLIEETFPKTIELSLALESNLPPIMADKNQIEQALLNLALNARDAMSGGGRLVFKTRSVDGATLHPLGKPEQRYACIEVKDTGVGIEESIRERIFEPFFTTKDKTQGTGLGLSVVYGIVKNHNGFVDVESKPLAGTSFRLYFPAVSAEITAKEPVAEIVPANTATSNGAGTVLLAEDEVNMLHLLEKIFLRRGYKVWKAIDGRTALDTYQRHKAEIGVVLLDMGLPKISGRDVLLKIRSENPDVKVIVTSGYIDPATKSEIDHPLVGFLHKPYAPEDVFKTLQILAQTALDCEVLASRTNR